MHESSHAEWIQVAQTVMNEEAAAVQRAALCLSQPFGKAVQTILEHKGKVIISGMGKSGYVAQKIAATLCSTGTPAVFLHPAEAIHGDLGVYSPGDPTILISKSGSTQELVRLLPTLRSFQSFLIAIVGNLDSPMARQCDVALDASVEREADPLGLAPTASTITALALGDALACALMSARRFTAENFAAYHPGGQLGRNLGLKTADVMHKGSQVAWLKPNDGFKTVIYAMSERNLGAACIVDEQNCLLGIITDGDLRRVLKEYENILDLCADEIMTKTPVTIAPNTSLKEALTLMEDRPSQISVLPVVDPASKRCLGLIRIHDIYQPTLY